MSYTTKKNPVTDELKTPAVGNKAEENRLADEERKRLAEEKRDKEKVAEEKAEEQKLAEEKEKANKEDRERAEYKLNEKRKSREEEV